MKITTDLKLIMNVGISLIFIKRVTDNQQGRRVGILKRRRQTKQSYS